MFSSLQKKEDSIEPIKKGEEPEKEETPKVEEKTPDSQSTGEGDTGDGEFIEGSMSSLINAAKEKIWAIATQIVDKKPKANIKMGLVAYRDRKDDYITKITDLTEDLDAMYYELMEFKAAGGGDFPESVNQGLNESVKKISWSKKKNVQKIIFLVGDAPPHMDYKNDVKYPVTCKLAVKLGIKINSIQCGTNKECKKYWEKIAKLGKGEYLLMEGSGRNELKIETPYDKEMVELSKKLDETRVYWGGERDISYNVERKRKAEVLYKKQSVMSSASRCAYQVSKVGYEKNFLGKQELINDFQKKKIDLKKIQKKLPKNMQKMKVKEQEKFLNEKFSEREKIRDQIKTLEMKRKKFKLEQKKKHKDLSEKSFESKVMSCI